MADEHSRGPASGFPPKGSPEFDAAAAAAERAASLLGRKIARRYRIDGLIAMGGVGAVYRGEHLRTGTQVAIKMLHPDSEGSTEVVARFEREAIVAAHVEHPNVASTIDFGRLDDGCCYLVLEHVEGITLHRLIKDGPLPVLRAVDIARQIAAGLAAVHDKGFVHRDVKPRNVMVIPGPPDHVKLIDFGLAKVPLERSTKVSGKKMPPVTSALTTADGVLFGTFGYMAPEAAFGMSAVDERADLYALGAILYEMLAGVPPFEAASLSSLFLKHRNEAPPSLRARAQMDVPPQVEAVAMRLLEKAPKDRYPTAVAAMKALEALLPPVVVPPPEEVAADAAPARDSEPSVPPVKEAPPPPPRISPPAAAPPPLRAAPPAANPWPKRRVATWAAAALLAPVLVLAAMRGLTSAGQEGTSPPTGSATPLAAELVIPPAPAPPPPPPLPEPAKAPSAQTAPSAAPEPSAPEPTATAPAIAEREPDLADTAEPTAARSVSAAAARRSMRIALETQQWARGATAILALAEIEPGAFKQDDIRITALDLTVGLTSSDDTRAAMLMDAFGTRLGADGVDMLYELASRRGGSRAAARASELLRRDDVRRHASPAVLIAFDLRDAPCSGKLALLERARAAGDLRTLEILRSLRSPECANGGCCVPWTSGLDDVIREVAARR